MEMPSVLQSQHPCPHLALQLLRCLDWFGVCLFFVWFFYYYYFPLTELKSILSVILWLLLTRKVLGTLVPARRQVWSHRGWRHSLFPSPAAPGRRMTHPFSGGSSATRGQNAF